MPYLAQVGFYRPLSPWASKLYLAKLAFIDFLQSKTQPFKSLTAQLGIYRFLFQSNLKPFNALSGPSWFLQASVPMGFQTLSGQVGV